MDIREFKNTDSLYAPSLIWDWCAKPTAEEIDARLSRFSQMGISTVFIRPSKGLVLPYLSEDYFELIRTCARRSAKYNIALWICDENSPCSGNGGGEITSVGDYRMRSIMRVTANDVQKSDIVVTKGTDTCVVLRDFSQTVGAKKAPLADITDPFVTECFLNHVYDNYIRQCKRFIGCEIRGFMTNINFPYDDILYSKPALKKMGHSEVSQCADEFINNEEFKNSYYRAMSSCISQGYTAAAREKCRLYDMELFTGVNGFSAISRQLQYIKSDRISLQVQKESPDLVEIKLAQTISSQFSKPLMIRLQLPLFAPCSQRADAAAFLSAMGAQQICYDSVAFSLSDRRKYENHTVSLSKFSERDITNRVSRFCNVVTNTESAAKILVIYLPHKKEIYQKLIQKFLNKGVDFHMVELPFFESFASFSDDAVNIGSCSYSSIICPDDLSIPDFHGRIITPEDSEEYDFSDIAADLTADNAVYVNRRSDEDTEYLFITAGENDTLITFPDHSLFAADSSNGEIYRLPHNEDGVTFTLKGRKTVLILKSENLSADIIPPMTDEIVITPLTTRLSMEFTLASAEENILPLKNVNACFGKKSYRENSIDNLHKEFYALSDNETVKVKYPFNVSLKDVGSVKAYIENADSLDFAELNGKRLDGFTPSDKDPRFMGIDVTTLLADGKNTFALEYKKCNNYTPDFSSLTPSHFYSYNITSFEPIYLCGDFDCKDGALTSPAEYTDDVASCGMPYYYGSLTYNLRLPESGLTGTLLKIHGDFDVCRIKIGKRENVFFSEAPLMEMFNLDCGGVAEITIFNTPYNLMRTSDSGAKPFGIRDIELCEF